MRWRRTESWISTPYCTTKLVQAATVQGWRLTRAAEAPGNERSSGGEGLVASELGRSEVASAWPYWDRRLVCIARVTMRSLLVVLFIGTVSHWHCVSLALCRLLPVSDAWSLALDVRIVAWACCWREGDQVVTAHNVPKCRLCGLPLHQASDRTEVAGRLLHPAGVGRSDST